MILSALKVDRTAGDLGWNLIVLKIEFVFLGSEKTNWQSLGESLRFVGLGADSWPPVLLRLSREEAGSTRWTRGAQNRHVDRNAETTAPSRLSIPAEVLKEDGMDYSRRLMDAGL
jgi:hypothetical protein